MKLTPVFPPSELREGLPPGISGESFSLDPHLPEKFALHIKQARKLIRKLDRNSPVYQQCNSILLQLTNYYIKGTACRKREECGFRLPIIELAEPLSEQAMDILSKVGFVALKHTDWDDTCCSFLLSDE